MTLQRYISRFENHDGTLKYKFPLVDYEWETSQNFVSPFVSASGMHYGLDLRDNAEPIKEVAIERLRWTVYERCGPEAINTHLDDVRSTLFRIGRGKLWTSDNRWAWARVISMPEYTMSFNSPFLKIQPMTAEWRRQGDWRGKNLITVNESAGATVIVDNPGNARVYDAVFTLNGTFTNPQIINNNNTYILRTNRDGSSSSHYVKFDSGKATVEYSSNGGVDYTDDIENFVRQETQVQFMILEPGENIFTFIGITSASFNVSFYPAYH